MGLLREYALSDTFWFVPETVLALTAGSMFVMWVSELITERGIGNGASLLIFVNIYNFFFFRGNINRKII